MSAQPVDVLAVMDEASASQAIREDRVAMREARAAVAEMIEAAAELRQRQREYLADPKGERSNDKGRLVGLAAERLDAALARCGGQP